MLTYFKDGKPLSRPEVILAIKLAVQRIEATREPNIQGAREEFGQIEPTDQVGQLCLVRHYENAGRGREVREVFSDENFWTLGADERRDPLDLPTAELIDALFRHRNNGSGKVTPCGLISEVVADLAQQGLTTA